MEKNQRTISLDILRIISMIMIIILHYFSYTSFINDIEPLSSMFFLKKFVCSFCNVSVNCFVLISGYFCLKTKFKLSKVLSLMIEVFSYSLAIFLILLCTKKITFDIKSFLFVLFPSLTRQYWFVTTYLGVYIFSPIIKNIVNNINKKSHLIILIVGFMLFVVYYNFFFFCDNLNFGGATGIVWFIYLYFVGTFIYKYYKPTYNIKKYIFCFLTGEAIAILSTVPFILLYLMTNKDIFLRGSSIFNSVYNSIFVFVNSVLFFLIFLNIKIKKYTKTFLIITNMLSTSSFAVYLLHENKYIRNIFWGSSLFEKMDNPIHCIFLCIATCITIYVTALIIETIRLKIYNVFFKKRVDYISDNIQEKVKNNFNILYEKGEQKYESKN